jgi:hypothetical protein
MFFLVVFTWATLTTEPPKVATGVFKTLDECLAAASQKNHPPMPGLFPREKWACVQLRGET